MNFILIFLTVCCFQPIFSVCLNGESSSFFIEANAVVEGILIRKIDTSLLSECVNYCAVNEQCSGANFLLTTDGSPICLLIDGSKKGLASETPTKEAVMYAIHSVCLKQPIMTFCQKREWTFEKFPNQEIKNVANVIFDVSNVSLSSCLTRCASRFDCAATAYNQKQSSCQLLLLSIQTVYDFEKHFRFSPDYDIYERNCQIKNIKDDFSNCTVMRLNQVGYTDVFDARLDAVADAFTCETICLSWKQGLCRSFTFDKREKRCFISHSSPKLFGWQPMKQLNDDFIFGEIDNCIKFDLFCGSGSLTLYGNSLKIFEGELKSKKNAAVLCEKNVTATHDFSFTLKYGECGIAKQPAHSYAGTILIKEGSTDMVTIRDRMIRIKCKMDNDKKPLAAQSLSFSLELKDNNSTVVKEEKSKWILKPIKAKAVKKPKYLLQVLSEENAVANVVNIGKKGHLLITMTGNSVESDFAISNLTAEDTTTKRKLYLIDSHGCVVNNSIVQTISKPTKSQIKIDIEFAGFSDKAQVVYHAVVKSCKTGCIPECNHSYYKKTFS